MKKTLHATFTYDDDELTKKDIKSNIRDLLGHCPCDIGVSMEGDERYKDPYAPLLAADETAAVALLVKAGVYWQCACKYVNPADQNYCSGCGEKRPKREVAKVKVMAEVHSDDHKFEAMFDATPWFEQASDEDIENLANCGFGQDYPADEVARHCSAFNEKVSKIFRYLELGPMDHDEPIGFECNVEGEQAREWVRENRPSLFSYIWKE